ncbi:MAG: EamA family transporter [Eubacteriales bacterium]|nr:EamA family transporter [Eubacteriales bacterium]
MNEWTKGAGILLISVFISSVSQILLKKAANVHFDRRIQEYLNVRVIAAYGLFFLSTVLTMLALRYVPLSLSPVLESAGYFFVAVMGYFFLHEKLTRRKLLGLCLIFLGIFVFTR